MLCQTFNYLFEKKTTTDAEQGRAEQRRHQQKGKHKSSQIRKMPNRSNKILLHKGWEEVLTGNEEQCACSACSQPGLISWHLRLIASRVRGMVANGAYNASDALRLPCMIDGWVEWWLQLTKCRGEATSLTPTWRRHQKGVLTGVWKCEPTNCDYSVKDIQVFLIMKSFWCIYW